MNVDYIEKTEHFADGSQEVTNLTEAEATEVLKQYPRESVWGIGEGFKITKEDGQLIFLKAVMK